MPKRSAAYMAERRGHIVKALETCVKRQGWQATTLDHVAEEAGLSKGAVYKHFGSKRALLMGMLERDIAAVETLGIGSREAFRDYLTTGLDLLARPEGWIVATGLREAQLEGVRDPAIRAMLARGAERAIEVFADIIRSMRPDLDVDGAKLRALGLLALLDGMMSMRGICDTMSEADMRALVDQQLDAALRG